MHWYPFQLHKQQSRTQFQQGTKIQCILNFYVQDWQNISSLSDFNECRHQGAKWRSQCKSGAVSKPIWSIRFILWAGKSSRKGDNVPYKVVKFERKQVSNRGTLHQFLLGFCQPLVKFCSLCVFTCQRRSSGWNPIPSSNQDPVLSQQYKMNR